AGAGATTEAIAVAAAAGTGRWRDHITAAPAASASASTTPTARRTVLSMAGQRENVDTVDRGGSGGVHVDLRGLQRHPHRRADGELQLVVRRERDLGDDALVVGQHAHARDTATQVDVLDDAVPDVARAAFGSRTVNGDGARVERREHRAVVR